MTDSEIKLRVTSVQSNPSNVEMSHVPGWTFNLSYDEKKLFAPNIELLLQE